jgi:hypothetical protein
MSMTVATEEPLYVRTDTPLLTPQLGTPPRHARQVRPRLIDDKSTCVQRRLQLEPGQRKLASEGPLSTAHYLDESRANFARGARDFPCAAGHGRRSRIALRVIRLLDFVEQIVRNADLAGTSAEGHTGSTTTDPSSEPLLASRTALDSPVLSGSVCAKARSLG